MVSAVVLVLLVIVAIAVLAWLSRPVDTEPDKATYQATAQLHAIRRSLDVARLQTEMRVDASQLRRELSEELRSFDADVSRRRYGGQQ